MQGDSGSPQGTDGGFAPWRWMRARWGLMLHDTDQAAGRRLFHAYDERGNSACEPIVGLGDGDQPTEGDLADLCPACVEVTRG